MFRMTSTYRWSSLVHRLLLFMIIIIKLIAVSQLLLVVAIRI